MDGHQRLGAGGDGGLDPVGVDVEGALLDVGEDRGGAGEQDRVDRRDKGEGAGALLGGLVFITAVARPRLSRQALPFVPAGIFFGLSYVALFEAFYRGRVTIVSPLVATESLVAVGLSALLLRQTELVGRRLALGTVLIVAGGALIGAFR